VFQSLRVVSRAVQSANIRGVSGNENTHNVSRRSPNGFYAFKRQRRSFQHDGLSHDEEGTTMGVDANVRCHDSDVPSDSDVGDWGPCTSVLLPSAVSFNVSLHSYRVTGQSSIVEQIKKKILMTADTPRSFCSQIKAISLLRVLGTHLV
jgi:hypothetical protein